MTDCSKNVADFFGENVFSIRTMRTHLSKQAYNSLLSTILHGQSLDPGIADEVAEAMRNWAMNKGATHYTHWFQPLTGATAEKHDSFVVPDNEGGAISQFSGKDLIKGEPDASSLPSDGIRTTFEARGYTAWDPTSPAFLKVSENGAALCIPTIFCGYHGEALDKKTPLLRSVNALTGQVKRLGSLFGIEPSPTARVRIELGPEQEYFLVDRDYYEARLDLLQTGRTLFGRTPAKHQQMEDHYFGAIKSRVLAFMYDLDRELWRLGVPAKTRHNEVSPGQFELAPVYEEMNLAVDHNMITMEVLRDIASRHGFACLLHEKPFSGVNGSGKHNNWSFTGPDGRNWLKPGEDAQDNAKFLTVICAIMKAVDTHAELLRASVATAANDLRLGGHEAPPSVISIFLGAQLTEALNQIGNGRKDEKAADTKLEIGVSSLPSFPRDMSDRNRTSPLAFTGRTFELRLVGSNQNCARACIVLNTIVAEALDYISTRVEEALGNGAEFNPALQDVLREIVRDHSRILFNGDNYSEDWIKEAEARGLPNVKSTPQALSALLKPETIDLFTRYGVMNERELRCRYDIYMRAYESTLLIEANCAVTIARTMILPAAMEYKRDLALSIEAGEKALECRDETGRGLLRELQDHCSNLMDEVSTLEDLCRGEDAASTLKPMKQLRSAVDGLEGLIPSNLWPLPSYAEMLFVI